MEKSSNIGPVSHHTDNWLKLDGPQGASHGGSEKPGKLEVGRASRDSTGLGALEEGTSPVEAGTAGYL